jgi:hypothetical protein
MSDAANPWSFTSHIKPASVDILDPSLDPHGDFTIEWEADLEVRSWGIKNITACVHRITGMFSSESGDSSSVSSFCATPGSFAIDAVFTQYPSFITIDLKEKTIVIE